MLSTRGWVQDRLKSLLLGSRQNKQFIATFTWRSRKSLLVKETTLIKLKEPCKRYWPGMPHDLGTMASLDVPKENSQSSPEMKKNFFFHPLTLLGYPSSKFFPELALKYNQPESSFGFLFRATSSWTHWGRRVLCVLTKQLPYKLDFARH